MIVSVLCPSSPFPNGGVAGIIGFANALAARGHEVHLVHAELLGTRIAGLDELGWIRLDERLVHHLECEPHEVDIPGSEVVLGFEDRLPDHLGEPALFIQAYRILPEAIERELYGRAVPKLCTSSWLRAVAIHLGNPPAQTHLVPYGIDHDKYRVSTPPADRPRRICMLVNRHPLKRHALGLDALDRVRRADPSVEVVTFGTGPRPRRLDDRVTYVENPSQAVLVDEIYDRSSIFLQTPQLEGFGLAPVEAMACGCALVTTDNGGSWDYAIEGRTAAVVAPDAGAIAATIGALLDDDERRIGLATGGLEHVRRFTWAESGRILEDVLRRYLADPGAGRQEVVRRYDERLVIDAHDVGDAPVPAPSG
jgi:glycosyltransferase involved in cell wall biosynthesis